jgi:hypothetical protein
MLVHVVMWRLIQNDPSDSPQALAEQLVLRLRQLSHCVDGLMELQAGRHALEATDAADVVLVARFTDEAALAAYQRHPAHLELAAWLKPRRTERRVVDFNT